MHTHTHTRARAHGADWLGGGGDECRLLQLNKDNEELREKRTTLEALLVLEREDMADLQKAHTDLQASLVEVATEKQQLVPHSLPLFSSSSISSPKWYRERTWPS